MIKQPSFIKEHLASWLNDRTHVHGPGSGSLRNGCEHLEGRGVLFCFFMESACCLTLSGSHKLKLSSCLSSSRAERKGMSSHTGLTVLI